MKQQTKQLNEVANVTSGFAFKSSEFTKEGIPIIRISNISDGEEVLILDKNQPCYNKEINDKLKNFMLKKEDILIALSGATTGKIGIYREEKPALLNQRIALIRSRDEKSNYYVYYFLQTKSQQILKEAYGGAQPNISPITLKSYDIYWPEKVEERQKIVSAIESKFSKIDNAIKNLKSAKTKIQLYKKAVLKKAFEKGEPKTFPDIISKEKHSMKRGPFGGSLKKEIFVPSGYLVYEQYHPINNDFKFGRYFITKEKFEEMKGFSVKPGDFLISCSGTIGKIAEIPKENFRGGIINQALLKITLDETKIDKKYFNYLFNSDYIQKYLTTISRGVAIKNVPSVKELKEIKFPVPSLPLQQTIVADIESKFSVIDKVEEIVDNSLKKAEMLKKSILKSAFEGRLVKE